MRLIYLRGDEEIAFPLDEGETFIGRKDDCDIYFPDTSLSKRHARLVRRGGSLTAEDAGSKNGTLVNGELLKGPRRLQDGDELQCGKLVFLVEGTGGDDFDIVDDAVARRSRSRTGAKTASGVVAARPVRSGEVRGSVLDEFPEVPGSGEGAGADAAPTVPTARLRLVEGGPERTFELVAGEPVTIGSKPENAVVLQGDGVSRYHAEVFHEGGKWVLKDLGARNGTFVAGQKVTLHELQPGDEVQIGTVKLRFERVEPSPLDAVKELFERLKADPVGTFKTEPRVRLGLATLVAAVFLMFMALPQQGGTETEQTYVDLSWVVEGTTKLQAGAYREAREVFKKAQAHVPSSQQDLPRTLTDVASLWCDMDKGAMTFNWVKAEQLLTDCAKLSKLPDPTKKWLGAQMALVHLNREAYDKLSDAETTGAQASQLATEKKLNEAMKRFELAILRYGEVPGTSAFAQRARDQSQALRQQVYALIIGECTARMQAPSPDWEGIKSYLGQAEAYADTPQQRAQLRTLKEDCDTNERDEELYQRGVDIVNARDLDNYPTAQRCFGSVDRRSRIYPDAQAYLGWIEADVQVRQAQQAYEQGDERRAFKLLNDALQHAVLGQQARDSVRTRRATWGRVTAAYNRGRELLNAGRTAEAKEEFQRVIQFEPNGRNLFVTRARDQLQHILQVESFNLGRKLREGLSALQNGEYDDAYSYFNQVAADHNRQPRDLQQIQEAVTNVSRQRRLVHTCQQDFLHDRSEKFLSIYYTMKLLRRWLPASEPHRADADKLYQDVLKRLQTLRLISETDPAD
jgi:pSer/pThr/pTyr-binding forkhead associated (FHA) protein/outer membrane protein assembly factor BamD (BamD/ComL family)